MFCDELIIKVIAGSGGDGGMSFRREKFVPKGGPDGGDGGNGGNIIIKVNPNLNTLGHMAHKKIFKAKNGVNGYKKNMHGANAENLIIEVPRGTIIFSKDKKEVFADLNKIDSKITIAKGGEGGLGNARFVSSTYQVPRFAETGEPGEEKEILIELKLVADVGLIGLPSAGKSTTISVISNAKPKIAAYYFTTLIPNLGIVNMEKFGGSEYESFIVADIPGLIEGASEGKGLGHTFLKHITRTHILVHILDASLDDIENDYKTIRKELETFDKKLAKRPEIIVLNKIDLISKEELEEKTKKLKKLSKKEIFLISAATNKGLKPLMFEILKRLTVIREDEKLKFETLIKSEELPVLKPHLRKDDFYIDEIIKEEKRKIYVIKGEKIEKVLRKTNISNPEGLERIYIYLDRLGIQKAAEKEEIYYGDAYKINDKIIPYRQ